MHIFCLNKTKDAIKLVFFIFPQDKFEQYADWHHLRCILNILFVS